MSSIKSKKTSLKNVFSSNVRKYRLELELSQEELAEMVGVHRTYIGSVERGERNVTINVIEKICTAFKRPITDFF